MENTLTFVNVRVSLSFSGTIWSENRDVNGPISVLHTMRSGPVVTKRAFFNFYLNVVAKNSILINVSKKQSIQPR